MAGPSPGGGKGQGQGHHGPQSPQSQVQPDQTFAKVAQAACGSVPGGRTWQKIFSDAKQKRNIIEVHIIKEKNTNNEETQAKPKYLTNDELSEFIFDVLKIKEKDCIGLDYFYGHKEIELKEGVDVTSFLHVETPIMFHEFELLVKRQEINFGIDCNIQSIGNV